MTLCVREMPTNKRPQKRKGDAAKTQLSWFSQTSHFSEQEKMPEKRSFCEINIVRTLVLHSHTFGVFALPPALMILDGALLRNVKIAKGTKPSQILIGNIKQEDDYDWACRVPNETLSSVLCWRLLVSCCSWCMSQRLVLVCVLGLSSSFWTK